MTLLDLLIYLFIDIFFFLLVSGVLHSFVLRWLLCHALALPVFIKEQELLVQNLFQQIKDNKQRMLIISLAFNEILMFLGCLKDGLVYVVVREAKRWDQLTPIVRKWTTEPACEPEPVRHPWCHTLSIFEVDTFDWTFLTHGLTSGLCSCTLSTFISN